MYMVRSKGGSKVRQFVEFVEFEVFEKGGVRRDIRQAPRLPKVKDRRFWSSSQGFVNISSVTRNLESEISRFQKGLRVLKLEGLNLKVKLKCFKGVCRAYEFQRVEFQRVKFQVKFQRVEWYSTGSQGYGIVNSVEGCSSGSQRVFGLAKEQLRVYSGGLRGSGVRDLAKERLRGCSGGSQSVRKSD
jgi:hypothetical protein